MGGLATGVAQDALEMAGAAALLLAWAALLARRAVTVRLVGAGQPVAIACAVTICGAARGEMIVAAIAAALMIGKAVAVWLALSRSRRDAPPMAGTPVVLAALTLPLALLATRQVAVLPGVPASNGVTFALALVLTGPLIAAARPVWPWSVAGVLGIESAAALAAVAVSPAAAATESVLALLAIACTWVMLRSDHDAPEAA